MPRGRTECVPPRKTPSALSQGFPPQGHLALAGPPLGGKGSARPQRKALRRPQDHPPFGHRFLANSRVAMTCPGLGLAPICGRAERVPLRKPPPTLSQGFPRKASPPAWLRRGGAGSARPQGRHHANPNIAPFRPRADPEQTRVEWNASAFARPYDADAETASLRENHFPRRFRAFPARLSVQGSASPRRGGLRTPEGNAWA